MTQYLSRSVSASTGCGAKASPSGFRTRWSATRRAASRYFFTRAGDIASDSAELSNPASLAGSTGNSRVGRMSTPVRSRIVWSYSALLSRRAGTGPGSPAFRFASSLRTAPIQAIDLVAGLGRRLPLRLRRGHRPGFELLQDQLPAREVLRHRLGGREAAQVEVALGLRPCRGTRGNRSRGTAGRSRGSGPRPAPPRASGRRGGRRRPSGGRPRPARGRPSSPGAQVVRIVRSVSCPHPAPLGLTKDESTRNVRGRQAQTGFSLAGGGSSWQGSPWCASHRASSNPQEFGPVLQGGEGPRRTPEGPDRSVHSLREPSRRSGPACSTPSRTTM